VRRTPHQRPWLLGLVESNLDVSRWRDHLTALAAERAFTRCLIAFDGDHGFWREERALEHGGDGWFLEIDDHRRIPSPPSPISGGEPLSQLFSQVCAVVEAPPQTAFRRGDRWIDADKLSCARAIPILAFAPGQAPCVARGFAHDQAFWAAIR
jgi:hypothetical protein